MDESPPQNQESTLRDYLRIVRRRRWVIVQAVVIVPVVAILFSLQRDARYEAEAKVLLTRENLGLLLSNVQDPSVYQQADRVADTQATVARVPAIAAATLARARMRGLGIDGLLANSSVAPEANSDILDFRVRQGRPETAQKLAGSYADAYVRYRTRQDTSALATAKRDVDARLQELEDSGQQDSSLYQSLVEKEQQLSTLETLQTNNAQVIARPRAAEKVQPKPLRDGALGLVLGLLLGIGLALLREALDTRVRSGEAVANALGIPLLGRLAEPSRKLQQEDSLVMMAEPDSPAAEGYRILRTNLEFANLESGAQTVMVTSAVQSEGKSTTIANLAVALARTGRRVVLVDLDLRRPYVGRFFGVGGLLGVTDAALRHDALDTAICQVPIGPTTRATYRTGTNGHREGTVLSVLPAGSIPPDPGEFVGSRALADVLEQLRARYELVLIDAPPLLNVGDAMALSRQVDALFLVARLEVLRRPMLKELRRLLAACPSRKLGIVVTGGELDDDIPDAPYYYYYGSRREGAKAGVN